MVNCGFPIEVLLARSDASMENIRAVLADAQFINAPPQTSHTPVHINRESTR